MKLATYFEQAPRGERTRVAGIVGVDYTTIWRIETERMSSSPSLAARISAATQGAVTVEELLYPDGLPEGARIAQDGDGSPEPDGLLEGARIAQDDDASAKENDPQAAEAA